MPSLLITIPTVIFSLCAAVWLGDNGWNWYLGIPFIATFIAQVFWLMREYYRTNL
jgi:hypothetical protein